jgi:hypothetical protein
MRGSAFVCACVLAMSTVVTVAQAQPSGAQGPASAQGTAVQSGVTNGSMSG